MGKCLGERTSLEALREILNREFLVLEGRAVLMVQPAELLQHLGVTRVVRHDPFVSFPGTNVLRKADKHRRSCAK